MGGPLDRMGRAGAREAMQHAVQVWESVRRQVLVREPGMREMTRGRGRAALDGQVDLAVVGLLGAHLSDCPVCWERWVDGYRPGDLLTAAVRRRPAGAILRAAELEMAERQRRQRGDAR